MTKCVFIFVVFCGVLSCSAPESDVVFLEKKVNTSNRDVDRNYNLSQNDTVALDKNKSKESVASKRPDTVENEGALLLKPENDTLKKKNTTTMIVIVYSFIIIWIGIMLYKKIKIKRK